MCPSFDSVPAQQPLLLEQREISGRVRRFIDAVELRVEGSEALEIAAAITGGAGEQPGELLKFGDRVPYLLSFGCSVRRRQLQMPSDAMP